MKALLFFLSIHCTSAMKKNDELFLSNMDNAPEYNGKVARLIGKCKETGNIGVCVNHNMQNIWVTRKQICKSLRQELLDWMRENGAAFHEALCLGTGSNGSGIFADQDIEPKSELAEVPLKQPFNLDPKYLIAQKESPHGRYLFSLILEDWELFMHPLFLLQTRPKVVKQKSPKAAQIMKEYEPLLKKLRLNFPEDLKTGRINDDIMTKSMDLLKVQILALTRLTYVDRSDAAPEGYVMLPGVDLFNAARSGTENAILVNEKDRCVIRAVKAIKKGEEVQFSYKERCPDEPVEEETFEHFFTCGFFFNDDQAKENIHNWCERASFTPEEKTQLQTAMERNAGKNALEGLHHIIKILLNAS